MKNSKYMMRKKLIRLTYALAVVALLTNCNKDDGPELDEPLSASDINYTVEQLFDMDPGGNVVVLRNNTPETVSAWDFQTGTSSRQVDTVYYAFAGEYTINLMVVTGGGIVYMDPIVITVSQDNLLYVDDPLWDALSGGPGNSKTWKLDLNAAGESVIFDGPLYFYGTENGWMGECTNEGGDCWNWNPDYPGNSWLMPAADFGTMTFSLITGPTVTVNHLTIPERGIENGTYNLNTDAKTLSMSNAAPLHDADRDACVNNWGDIQLFSLTEESMQLGVIRRADCDGAVYLVYNYIAE